MITNQISLEDCLSFELSPYPPSLFNEEGFLRSGTKSDLSTYFFDQRDDEPEIPLAETTLIVIDGGALLHRVIWDVGMSFKDIINKYKIYIKSSFKNFRLEVLYLMVTYCNPPKIIVTEKGSQFMLWRSFVGQKLD